MKVKQLYLAPECDEFGLRLEGVIAMAGLVLFAACSAKRRLTASTLPSVWTGIGKIAQNAHTLPYGWTGIGKIGSKRAYPAIGLDRHRHPASIFKKYQHAAECTFSRFESRRHVLKVPFFSF